MSADADVDEIIERIIGCGGKDPVFGFDLKIVVREPKKHIEFRARYLRWCALLSRVWNESYENKLPPLEFRTRHVLHAWQEHAVRVAEQITPLVLRIDAIAPGGCMGQWHEAVEAVGRMTFEECERELCSLPLAS